MARGSIGLVRLAKWLAPVTTAMALALGVLPAAADTGAWDRSEPAAVRLISAVTATGQSETLPFGLEFQLEPTWKIYWRTPGTAGLPPVPDWSDSLNVASVSIAWPTPERFSFFDIGTVGYKTEVIFPLTVAPERPGDPVQLRGGIDYLVCSDEICIPGRADVALDLPSGDGEVSSQAHVIDRYAAAVPVTDSILADLAVEDSAIRENSDGTVTVEIAIAAASGDLTAPDVFLEGPNGIYFDKPVVSPVSDKRAILAVTAPDKVDLASLTAEPLTATVVDGMRALEVRISPTEGALTGPKTDSSPPVSLIAILGLALLGGLILNLMPCVLPVLSLKLMSVVSKSGKGVGAVRAGFLASSAGIVSTFLLLAGAAIAVKQAGLSVGWGIQFQQPVFLALMVALLTLFACNLAGLFEFRLPGFLNDRMATAGSDGQSLTGDFLTGAFATLLATPCSAPFLGTAVGFALASGPGEILAVFLALGIGLALPYLIVAAVPGLVKYLPRPGRWMLILKSVLALALVGTAVWLLTVLAAILGTENAAAIGLLAAVAAGVLASRRVEGSRLGRAAWPVSAALAVATVLAPLTMSTTVPSQDLAIQDGDIAWQPFDEAAIPGLLSQGKTVLVDVTADWCVTCQWNKRTVLLAEDVATWIASPDVVAMKADWTRPDPAIAGYLARHGRYGIPFNIVYGPGAPDGIALPELLSVDGVLAAAATADPNARIAERH